MPRTQQLHVDDRRRVTCWRTNDDVLHLRAQIEVDAGTAEIRWDMQPSPGRWRTLVERVRDGDGKAVKGLLSQLDREAAEAVGSE